MRGRLCDRSTPPSSKTSGQPTRIKVECGGCKRVSLIAANGLGLPPHTSVLSLKPSLRCQECGAKGRAVVSVLWVDSA